jgi:hypothetical protein
VEEVVVDDIHMTMIWTYVGLTDSDTTERQCLFHASLSINPLTCTPRDPSVSSSDNVTSSGTGISGRLMNSLMWEALT